MNVDYPEVPTVEWFFGYGGNHLGLKRVVPGLRLVAVCEIEAFPIANMVSKMEAGLLDAAPCWTDCRTFPAEPFKNRIALFIASYPCQGFSLAGKRLGTDDPRHLWPHVRRFEQTARPLWVFFENVRGHVSLGLSTVLSDLREDGYRTEWGIFSAAECGAPHNRERVFILGKLADRGHLLGCAELGEQQEECAEEFQGSNQLAHGECGRRGAWIKTTGRETGNITDGLCGIGRGEGLADAIKQGLQGHADAGDGNGSREPRRIGSGQDRPTCRGCLQRWPSRPGEEQFSWEPPRVVGSVVSKKVAERDRQRLLAEDDGLRDSTRDHTGYVERGNGLADSISRREPQPEGMQRDDPGRSINEGEGVEQPESRGCGIVLDEAQPRSSGHPDSADATVGDATERQDDGRGPRDVEEATGEGGCINHADGTGENLGDTENADRRRGRRGEKTGAGTHEERRRGSGEPSQGDLGDTGECGSDGRTSGLSRGKRESSEDVQAHGGESRETNVLCEVEFSLGRNSSRTSNGVDMPELSSLSDSELAEIYEWMERCDNRTDELRLLGNGVVPDTAERAFIILYGKLMEKLS